MITLLPADRVPSSADLLVCRHSVWRAFIIAGAGLAVGAVLLWVGGAGGSGLSSYLGGLTLLSLLVFHKLVLARVRASNWLLRLADRGVFIQFRSYLNHHLSPVDPTVAYLPYEAIRGVRRRTERKQTAYRDSDDAWTTRTSVSTITWVEFEVNDSTGTLAQALDAEVSRRPTSGALYRDYPVRVPMDGVIQVRWTVQPEAEVLLEALRSRVAIGEPAETDTDFTDLRSRSTLEQRQRIAELVRAGDTLTALSVARALYGGDLTEAKAFVDRLAVQGAQRDVPRVVDYATAVVRAARPERPRTRMAIRVTWRRLAWHAFVAVIATYPMAAICVSVFRFPVPLGGYVSGASAIPLSALAVTVYGGVFGGFVLQAMMGVLAGLLTARVSQRPEAASGPVGTVLAAAASIPGVFALAILDRLIGPW